MKLYDELAAWWPLMSPPGHYADEAATLVPLLQGDAVASRARVLELGSGGGHLASHLKRWFDMTLVDLSPRMLDLSRTLNPECRHLEGDMRNLRLGETFDAVLIHDAVSHLCTHGDLAAALRSTRAHLRPGGSGVFCPDFTVECFSPGTTHGGSDDDGRGLRYIEWVQPEIAGTTYRSDIVYLLREDRGALRIEHDCVTWGIFARAQWTAALGEAGFGGIAVETVSARDIFTARAA